VAQEGFFIHQFEFGPWQNFMYLVGDKATRTAAVVDPAWNYEVILDEARALDVRITDILCTHSHFDHVNEVEAMLTHTDARVHMLGEEIDFAAFRCENLVRHAPGDRVRIGRHAELTMMHTPGHTPGSTCYHVHGTLVTGDTMFVNGCGRCDFVGGNPETMYRTLHGLVDALPGETVMYPGHNYGPTPVARLDAQLETNPYLKLPTLADFVAHRMAGKTPGTVIPPPAWPPPEGRPKK